MGRIPKTITFFNSSVIKYYTSVSRFCINIANVGSFWVYGKNKQWILAKNLQTNSSFETFSLGSRSHVWKRFPSFSSDKRFFFDSFLDIRFLWCYYVLVRNSLRRAKEHHPWCCWLANLLHQSNSAKLFVRILDPQTKLVSYTPRWGTNEIKLEELNLSARLNIVK